MVRTCLCSLLITFSASLLMAEDELYAPLSAEETQREVENWLAKRQIDTPVKEQIAKIWNDSEHPISKATSEELHEKTIQTFLLVDASLNTFQQLVSQKEITSDQVEEAYEAIDLSESFFASQIQHHFGRELSQHKMYDEALTLFEEAAPQSMVDPASYLFYRSVCEHQLFMKTEGLATIKKLTQDTEGVPTRYAKLAEMMKYDLEQTKAKSLRHVASKMKDSERRLALARTGHRVQKVQGEIVILLDEIIEKMEQQCKQCNGQGEGQGQNNSNQSSSPANESSVKGSTAPGVVDKKNYKKNRSVWGLLPEKEEAHANNIINKNFPSHYRKAIEQYTKELAKLKANGKSVPGTP